MSESPFRSVTRTEEVEAKVKNKAGLEGCSGDRSYARVVDEEGPRKGDLLPVGKWAKAVICEGQVLVQDWGAIGKALARMMGVRGMTSINPFSAFKGVSFVDSVE